MSLAVTVCCRVAENEIQNKQARLLHIPFTLPCYSSIPPILFSLSPLTLFYFFFFLPQTNRWLCSLEYANLPCTSNSLGEDHLLKA